jgi:putative transposase
MMTETLVGVGPLEKASKKSVTPAEAERAAVRELVRAARARGEDLTGPDGLLKVITKTVLESALEEEMSEHVGYDKHTVEGRNGGNSRNGTRSKTVLTEAAGEVQVQVPRDRDGTFEPVVVRKRQRRLSDVDAVAISLYAKGLTTGEISAQLRRGVRRVGVQGHGLEDLSNWRTGCSRTCRPGARGRCSRCTQRSSSTRSTSRSPDSTDGQVGNQPFYAAIGVDLFTRLPGTETCSGCGPGTVVGSRPNSG